MAVAIARQPIYDRRSRTHAYELLYRGDPDAGDARVGDSEHATASVLSILLAEMGIAPITGGRPAFINFSRQLLERQYLDLLPRKEVVIEVLEDVVPDEELHKCLAYLRQQGFRIALDDFTEQTLHRELLPYADIVKVDVLGMKPDDIVRHASEVREHGVPKLLAEKVEDREIANFCKRAGYDYFQGFFLSRPTTLRQRRLDAGQAALLRLISALQDLETDAGDLERIIMDDPTLTYRLLRYMASPVFGVRDIDSIRGAIMYLGRRRLRDWATLMALSGSNPESDEITRMMLVRARTAELLGKASQIREQPDKLFTAGILSGLDAVFNVPMDRLLQEMALAEDVREALLGGVGPIGEILGAVRAQEQGDWARARTPYHGPGDVAGAYLDALQWSDERMDQILRVTAGNGSG